MHGLVDLLGMEVAGLIGLGELGGVLEGVGPVETIVEDLARQRV